MKWKWDLDEWEAEPEPEAELGCSCLAVILGALAIVGIKWLLIWLASH